MCAAFKLQIHRVWISNYEGYSWSNRSSLISIDIMTELPGRWYNKTSLHVHTLKRIFIKMIVCLTFLNAKIPQTATL